MSFKASTESLVAERGRPRNGSSAKGAGAGGVGENIVVGQKIKKGVKREKSSGNCNNMNLY